MGATHYSWMCLISTFFFKKKMLEKKRLRINVIGQKAIVSPKQGQADAGFIVYSRKRKVSVLSN